MIDSSGSMQLNDPTNCRLEAAKDYIGMLTSPDRVSILDFDGGCYWTPGGGLDHHLDSPGHDGVPDYGDPMADVDTINADGATNLLCPIQLATAELLTLGNASRARVEILLTDGMDSVGNTHAQILAAAQEAADNGITIHTIAFNAGGMADVDLLEQIANVTGGQYYETYDCDQIVMAYQSIYQTVTGNPPPAAPRAVDSRRDGADLRVTWQLSVDDAAGANDVSAYEVWHGTTHDGTAATYALLATLPAGRDFYTHLGAGSDGQDHFYQVRAIDGGGNWGVAAEQAGKIARDLPAGRHLLSVPLVPADWSVPSVFQSLPWTRVRAFGGGQWALADPDKPVSTLSTMDGSRAFWVETASAARWVVAGKVPGVTPVPLRAGWNLIGYPSFTARPAAEVLAGVSYLAVEGFADEPPYYLRPLASSELMEPGAGYWVLASQGAILTFTN